ncbi:hypothetical protein [Chitinimonas lacunae]|uniref:Tle cognate immunity protein 4 C-terminal domain-containing protein n=1 Tax=Chitinimonas lacunae TaxID=1963018 RepID=A0ABV8MQF3_9NEIS
MSTLLLAATATLAIVTQDQAALRAAPRDSAPQQAVLWQGESLEIRGERLGYLQVYDHVRERGGYIRASQVRTTRLDAATAPELRAVIRFLRDTPGAEALGIGYGAAYLKAAPAQAIDAELFDMLGSMAERLGRRASGRQGRTTDATLAAHLQVAANYGIKLSGVERDGRVQLCYDGDAFRRVLALPADASQQTRAALALTRHDCLDPLQSPPQRHAVDQWRASLLNRIDGSALPEFVRNRLRLRQAGVWAALAFQHARRGEAATQAAQQALDALASVVVEELSEEDRSAYSDAAIRVGASRWAALPAAATDKGLSVITQPGEPGQTCVLLVDARRDTKSPLFKTCSYGLVWTASASANPDGTALTLAVQPLEGWRELWLFRRGVDGWQLTVLPPSNQNPDLGYIEFAGWVPGGKQMLAAREVKVDGRFQRSFELIDLETLAVQKQADHPNSLSTFHRWQSPRWKQLTVSLRQMPK